MKKVLSFKLQIFPSTAAWEDCFLSAWFQTTSFSTLLSHKVTVDGVASVHPLSVVVAFTSGRSLRPKERTAVAPHRLNTQSQLESFSLAIFKRKSAEVGIAFEKRGNPAWT